MLLSRGDAGASIDLLSRVSLQGSRSDVTGETLATFALAYACVGDERNAVLKLESATPLAIDITTQVFVAATTAILAADSGADALDRQMESFAHAVGSTGNFDSAVCALRADRRLLRLAARHPSMRGIVHIAATRSGDASLAAALGTPPPKRVRTEALLSARELEVLQLAAEGFHNVEIGERLFISAKTVKTHLQNVYEKLQVNSRTEAAIKAKDAGLLR
jgi:DNA-binding CsgD family transcriptional regulator